jgi:hypothetical protein
MRSCREPKASRISDIKRNETLGVDCPGYRRCEARAACLDAQDVTAGWQSGEFYENQLAGRPGTNRQSVHARVQPDKVFVDRIVMGDAKAWGFSG